MLEQSAAELKATVEELEKRYDTIDNEGKILVFFDLPKVLDVKIHILIRTKCQSY